MPQGPLLHPYPCPWEPRCFRDPVPPTPHPGVITWVGVMSPPSGARSGDSGPGKQRARAKDLRTCRWDVTEKGISKYCWPRALTPAVLPRAP